MLIAVTISFGIQLILAFIGAYVSVILFNYYTVGKLTFQPFFKKAWIKVAILILPFYFIVNAVVQSGFSSNLRFGHSFENFPNYLVFFATVLSVYLLYRTLFVQIRYNKVSAFENRFFKFMDFHRENVNLLKYRDPKSELMEEKYFEGNQVFTVIYYEIKELLTEIRKAELYGRGELRKSIDLAYQSVFYGSGDDGKRILFRRFDRSVFKKFDFLKKQAKYGGVYYSGHVRRLGHYFRNIYQAIKYVEMQDYLTEDEKYKYITHFRAQMSVYEQGVFFFNSLSELGLVWEYENYLNRNPTDIAKRKEVYKKLYITKYDLIRNTLNNDGEIIPGVSIKKFYPLITLERVEEEVVSAVMPFENNYKSICRYCFNENYIGYKLDDRKAKVRAQFLKLSEFELFKFNCSESKCESMEIRNELLRKPRRTR